METVELARPEAQTSRHMRRITRTSGFQWWFPISLFLGVRMLNAITIAFASRNQIPVDRANDMGMYVHTDKPANPGYWGVITNWDGQWYESIATEGYGAPQPGATDGEDALWTWAFPPLFPLLARCVMLLTGLPFAQAATILNLLFGALGMVLLYKLLNRAGGVFLAVSGIALINCFISAPLIQAAYSESVAFMLLMGVFLKLQARSYLTAGFLICLLAFTRLITAPLALIGLVHLMWLLRGRGTNRIPARQVAGIAFVVFVSLVGTFMWPMTAGALASGSTGASARLQAQSSFHLGWFSDAYHYFGPSGTIAVALLLLFLLLLACSPRTQHWGLELRTWLAAYPSFLMLVTGISGGIFRYLLLCPPIALIAAGGPAAPRRQRTAVVLGACLFGLALQYLWIHRFLAIPGNHLMP